MAGYSSTPLPRKLGIREGHRVLLLGAPAGFEKTLGALPALASVERSAAPREAYDVIVQFQSKLSALPKSLDSAKARLGTAGGLWIAWPKKASGVATDVTEGDVRACGLAAGLVDNKVCAIDETWSGLRFVYRLADRPKKSRK